jgi:hypothetical protein
VKLFIESQSSYGALRQTVEAIEEGSCPGKDLKALLKDPRKPYALVSPLSILPPNCQTNILSLIYCHTQNDNTTMHVDSKGPLLKL